MNEDKEREKEKKVYRGKWYTFYPTWSGFHITYELAGYFDSRPYLSFHLFWGKLYLYFPWIHLHTNPYLKEEEKLNMDRKKKLDEIIGKKSKDYIKKVPYDECDPPRYGVYYHERSFWFPYGNKIKCIHLPWELDWVRTSCLRKDGSWENETKKSRDKNFWDKSKWNDILFMETHPYQYTTKNGTVQNVQATIRVEEREWRWRGFKWFKWINTKRKSIDIEFSDDIGERKGTYKGGTIGCSYEMLPKEKPYECLKRMEREREFK